MLLLLQVHVYVGQRATSTSFVRLEKVGRGQSHSCGSHPVDRFNQVVCELLINTGIATLQIVSYYRRRW